MIQAERPVTHMLVISRQGERSRIRILQSIKKYDTGKSPTLNKPKMTRTLNAQAIPCISITWPVIAASYSFWMFLYLQGAPLAFRQPGQLTQQVAAPEPSLAATPAMQEPAQQNGIRITQVCLSAEVNTFCNTCASYTSAKVCCLTD